MRDKFKQKIDEVLIFSSDHPGTREVSNKMINSVDWEGTMADGRVLRAL